MMCAMESKFALMKGVPLPGRSCSVLKGIEALPPPKPAEVTDKPDSNKPDRERPPALQVKCHLLGKLVSCGAGNTGLT